jgi:hypothetical protein
MRLRVRVERVLAVALLSIGPTAPGAGAFDDVRPAPPLPTEASRWVGPPTTWEALGGRVTLVFVWTFG